MGLSLPDGLDFEVLRTRYADHLVACTDILNQIPDAQRMRRRNAGFHHDSSAVAGLLKDAVGRTAKPRLLEIGVWKAATLSYALKTAGRGAEAVGIDIFQFEHQQDEAQAIIDGFGLTSSAQIFARPSHRIPRPLVRTGRRFDVIHVDAGHGFEDAVRDILVYSRFCLPGGWIVVDDYLDNEHSPEVRQAVDYIVEGSLLPSHNHGTVEGFSNYFFQLPA